jgi:rhodanese-related sulfurtransferase
VNFPLSSLREKLHELPQDKKLYVYCQVRGTVQLHCTRHTAQHAKLRVWPGVSGSLLYVLTHNLSATSAAGQGDMPRASRLMRQVL